MKYDRMNLKVVSRDNILAWIEAGLRSFKAIDENMEVETIKIPYSGFNSDKASDQIGVEIYYKKPIREEDISFKRYGKGL